MIRICVFNAHPKCRISNAALANIARTVLRREGSRAAECNLIFVDDKRMVDLNGTFLDHWFATDVLSFPMHTDDEEAIEGEVYINVDQAGRQAREYGVSRRNELARLAIHGILHLLGYNDRTKAQRIRMSRLENRYLTFLK